MCLLTNNQHHPGEKIDTPYEGIAAFVTALLDTIQNSLFEAAKRGRDEKLVYVTEWKDFVPALERQCLVMTPFCDDREWEEKVKVGTR
jgi:prolyl-tRNA synthetase